MSLGGGVVMWGRASLADRRPAFYVAPAGRRLVDASASAVHGVASLVRRDRRRPGATLDGGASSRPVLAFFLAVGVAAHALDEVHGHPLRTPIPSSVLAAAATVALAGAVVLGSAGVARVGLVLVAFIVVGPVLVAGYNLELFGGRLHTDIAFALAWE